MKVKKSLIKPAPAATEGLSGKASLISELVPLSKALGIVTLAELEEFAKSKVKEGEDILAALKRVALAKHDK